MHWHKGADGPLLWQKYRENHNLSARVLHPNKSPKTLRLGSMVLAGYLYASCSLRAPSVFTLGILGMTSGTATWGTLGARID